jgi:rsbT co-antagonist protein RsbR
MSVSLSGPGKRKNAAMAGDFMQKSGGRFSVELNRTHVEWDLDAGTALFFGRPMAMFWLDPSLLRLLRPLVEEVGVPLFRVLVADQASLGTDEDYNAMVTALGQNFEEGFLAWGRAVGAAGWGRFSLPVIDRERKRAVVEIEEPWELRMQESVEQRWGCPFLMGKVIGIFSHALGANCWADESDREENGKSIVRFEVYPSERTTAREIDELRLTSNEAARSALEQRVAQLTERHQAILSSLGDAVFTLDREGRVTSLHVPHDHARSSPDAGVVGSTLTSVWPERAALEIAEAMAGVIDEGKNVEVDYEAERGGEARSFRARLSPLRDRLGRVLGVTLLEHDTTERVRIERELEGKRALVERHEEEIRALSTPILQVWRGVLALPLLGAVDDRRADDISARLLDEVSRQSAEYVILDLTGVAELDAATAEHFGRITRGVGLLGASCVVCGMRPAAARAMAELGEGLSATRTFGTMEAALRFVIGRVR